MPSLGRPIVNRERDQRIFADVELERRQGLSLRRSYVKTAESGDFGAMSARTVESAYRKERQRRRLARGRIAAASNAQILAAAVAPNAQFLAAVAERAERNAQFLAAAAAPNAQFLAAARRHSLLFRHLR